MVNPDATENLSEEKSAPGGPGNGKGDGSDKVKVLLAMFEHYANVGLDHQRQSATTSNILLVVAGAILTFIGLDKNLHGLGDAVGAAAVAIIGGFGMIWSWKQHAIYRYWTKTAEAYQKELFGLVLGLEQDDELSSQTGTETVKKSDTFAAYKERISVKASTETAEEFGAFTAEKLRIRYLWVGLHGLVAILGIVLAVAILINTLWDPVLDLFR